MILLLLLLLLLLLQGCSNYSVKEGEWLREPVLNGSVLMSVNYDGYYAKYQLFMRNKDTMKEYEAVGGGHMTPFHLFDPDGNMDHLGERGDLVLLELPVGQYYISGWNVNSGNGIPLHRAFPSKLDFEVKPGETIYLGSIKFTQTSTYGLTVSGVKVHTKNEYERDYNLAKKYWPSLVNQVIHIEESVMGYSLLERRGNGSTLLNQEVQDGVLQILLSQ